MRFAVNSGRLEPEFNPFTHEFLEEILRAVAHAWARMKRPKSDEIEDRITFRLAGRLQNDPIFRNLPYDIVPQYWLLGIDGRRLGRLDLRFKHRNSQKDYFAFESKRLHVRYPGGSFGSEYSVYSGVAGMGAFLDGLYSGDLPAAGMLGYVMDGDTERARQGMMRNLVNRQTELNLQNATLALASFSLDAQNSLGGTLLMESKHQLSERQLRLFHMLLPCRKYSGNPIRSLEA